MESKRVYTSKLKPLNTVFSYSIKLSGYKVGIKYDKDPLVVEQNNYETKIVSAYIVYKLDAWPRNPTNNFTFKNCLFGVTSVVKNNDEEKWVYSSYGIAFSSAGSWNLSVTMLRML